MNIVTGAFVQSTIEKTKEDTDFFMVSSMSELFGTAKEILSWEDFSAKLYTPQMRAYFQAIDVDPSEAEGVFQLLDLNDQRAIDKDEFLNGCLRLRGPAKALDLALLMHEVRRMASHLQVYQAQVENM